MPLSFCETPTPRTNDRSREQSKSETKSSTSSYSQRHSHAARRLEFPPAETIANLTATVSHFSITEKASERSASQRPVQSRLARVLRSLAPWQRLAVEWMRSRETSVPNVPGGGVLGDATGLGKRMCMLALILRQRDNMKSASPSQSSVVTERPSTLIVVPSHRHGDQWSALAERMDPHGTRLRVLRIDETNGHTQRRDQYDIVIVLRGQMSRRIVPLMDVQRVVLDNVEWSTEAEWTTLVRQHSMQLRRSTDRSADVLHRVHKWCILSRRVGPLRAVLPLMYRFVCGCAGVAFDPDALDALTADPCNTTAAVLSRSYADVDREADERSLPTVVLCSRQRASDTAALRLSLCCVLSGILSTNKGQRDIGPVDGPMDVMLTSTVHSCGPFDCVLLVAYTNALWRTVLCELDALSVAYSIITNHTTRGEHERMFGAYGEHIVAIDPLTTPSCVTVPARCRLLCVAITDASDDEGVDEQLLHVFRRLAPGQSRPLYGVHIVCDA